MVHMSTQVAASVFIVRWRVNEDSNNVKRPRASESHGHTPQARLSTDPVHPRMRRDRRNAAGGESAFPVPGAIKQEA